MKKSFETLFAAGRRMQPSGLLTMKKSLGLILYVEDDEDTRELVTCVLAMNNYKVVAAENCEDALMLVRSGITGRRTGIGRRWRR